MILKGEIGSLHCNGDSITVNLTNVRAKGEAAWRSLTNAQFVAPMRFAKALVVGRVIELSVKLK